METQDYGVQRGEVNGDVSQTMPMLGIYYYLIGLYATYTFSESETSGSETSYPSEEIWIMSQTLQTTRAIQVTLISKVWSACNTLH